MRKMLRKWLGIDAIDKSLETMVATEPRSETLRRMIGEAFKDALEGKSDSEWWPILSMHHIPNTLERALDNASRKTASEVAQAHIEHRIKPESFIDEVVDRIRRKQVA